MKLSSDLRSVTSGGQQSGSHIRLQLTTLLSTAETMQTALERTRPVTLLIFRLIALKDTFTNEKSSLGANMREGGEWMRRIICSDNQWYFLGGHHTLTPVTTVNMVRPNVEDEAFLSTGKGNDRVNRHVTQPFKTRFDGETSRESFLEM